MQNLIGLLKKEIAPALGCTEPIAVSLAAARARQTLEKKPDQLVIELSSNILKNGMAVGIPGTGMTGLYIAAALGAIAGNPDAKLEVLRDVSESDINESKAMVDAGSVSITKSDNPEKLYIQVTAVAGSDSARVIISKSHTNISLIEKNGRVQFQEEPDPSTKWENTCTASPVENNLSVEKIYEFAENVPIEDILFLEEGSRMNMALAREGLNNHYGLGVGRIIRENVRKGCMSDDITTHTTSLAAAAADARMGGCSLPAMSNSGSGNQGLTIFIPIQAVADRFNSGKEKTLRALALGNLIAIHVKNQIGRLSALCGVVTAACGVSSGITLLMGGSAEQVGYAIKNMAGNIAGMICDGAKPGCALKVSTAVSAAVQSAFLAVNHVCISELDGIVARDVEATIDNIAAIGSRGMESTDRMILDIMVNKN